MMRMLMREIPPGRRTIRSRFLRKLFVDSFLRSQKAAMLCIWERIMGVEV